MSAVSWRPVAPYMHDGHRMHPKLTYALPPGMGESLASLGLFMADEDPADVDLSAMPWDASTHQSATVTPAPLGHEQHIS